MLETKEFGLPSGATLCVNVAPFDDAMALHDEIMEIWKYIPTNDNPLDLEVSELKVAVISALRSKALRSALFRCFERCTYRNLKLTKDLFDAPDLLMPLREDYFVICWHVIEVNEKPFLIKAFSELKNRLKTGLDTLRPTSEPALPS